MGSKKEDKGRQVIKKRVTTNNTQLYRGVRKTTAQNKLSLAKDTENKRVIRQVQIKRKEKVQQLLNGDSKVLVGKKEKAFFISVLSKKRI